MNEFNQLAIGWDDNISHMEWSLAVAKSIKAQIPIRKDWRALEYGAGTGILSFILKDEVKETYMMDSSEEIVKVMQRKVIEKEASNLYPVLFDMEKELYSGEKFNLLNIQMVLHHIMDIQTIINRFYSVLTPGGYIAIADLYAEDGSFHDDRFTGHNGFDLGELSEQLVAAGFINPKHQESYVRIITKQNGEIKSFPIFLLTAQK